MTPPLRMMCLMMRQAVTRCHGQRRRFATRGSSCRAYNSNREFIAAISDVGIGTSRTLKLRRFNVLIAAVKATLRARFQRGLDRLPRSLPLG